MTTLTAAAIAPLASYDAADCLRCGCSGARVSIVSPSGDGPAYRVCTFSHSEVRVHGLDAAGAETWVDTDAAGADAITL